MTRRELIQTAIAPALAPIATSRPLKRFGVTFALPNMRPTSKWTSEYYHYAECIDVLAANVREAEAKAAALLYGHIRARNSHAFILCTECLGDWTGHGPRNG